MSKWISVEERLPARPPDVSLVYDGRFIWMAVYDERKWIMVPSDDEELGGVTHWMPLPEPPEKS